MFKLAAKLVFSIVKCCNLQDSRMTLDFDLSRTEVCTLLLCHGADPTLINCHNKTAIDLAPTDELKQRIECMH